MNKHIKMCSTALDIRKMNIKNTVRYYSLPTRMPVVKKTDKYLVSRMWRSRNSHTLLVGM